MSKEISDKTLTTSFNDFGKIHLIEDAGKNLSMRFYYGPDLQRWYSVLSQDGTDVRTTIYANGYEKITENGRTREFYYLDGNTIIVKENGIMKKYLAFTDNLGSILSVMDKDGNKVFDASYDAWGRQTITLNTIGLQRGYTGHEMINEFDIINMNGRLYDPVLGRFFSPDNYVQMPDNSQNFNRYSYCLNNPLKYTDPSGNLSELIAFAAFSAINSMMQAKFNGENVWKAGALSLLSSAASYGIGEAFKGATATFGNELLRAGAHGLASGVISALDGGNFTSSFISGAAASGIGSYAQSVHINNGLMVASTTAMGGLVAWATGGDFLMGAMQGMKIGLLNHDAHEEDDGIRYYHDENGNLCGDMPNVDVIGDKDYKLHHTFGYILFGDLAIGKTKDWGYGPWNPNAISLGIGINGGIVGMSYGIEVGGIVGPGEFSPYFSTKTAVSYEGAFNSLKAINLLQYINVNAYASIAVYTNNVNLDSIALYSGTNMSSSLSIGNIGYETGNSYVGKVRVNSYGLSVNKTLSIVDYSRINTTSFILF